MVSTHSFLKLSYGPVHLLGDKMDKPSNFKEKRKKPRVLVNLYVNLKIVGEANHRSGVICNGSETGLLINTLHDMPPGKKVIIEVLSANRGRSFKFKALTQVVWKDIGFWDDWEGYVYGLKFIQILDGDSLKFKQVLGIQADFDEALFSDKPNQRLRQSSVI